MVIKIRDSESREIIGYFNSFTSLIWTERFNSYGDFELEAPALLFDSAGFRMDQYIEIPTSSRLMIIEKIEIKGDTFKVSGRSLESILDRRIIAEERITEAKTGEKPSYIIYKAILDSFGSTSGADRAVNYIGIQSTDEDKEYDEEPLKKYTVSRGENLYDFTTNLLAIGNYGFKILFNPQTLDFRITALYDGEKRENVIFSQNSFNLTDPSYKEDSQNLKTAGYVAGDGEGTKRRIVVLSRQTSVRNPETGSIEKKFYKGIHRREMWIDARDLQKRTQTNDDYKALLKDRGIEKMSEKNKEYTVDGTIVDTGRYRLGVDYDLGDTVIIRSKYFSATVKIMEIIQSIDQTGAYKIYPTFTVIDVDKPEINETFNLGS